MATGHSSAVVGISVDFEVNSKNGLRQILLGLDKTVEPNLVTWSIRFALNERDKKGDAWTTRVKLNVSVESIHNNVAEIASKTGLSMEQTTYLLTDAAKEAKAAQAAKDSATTPQAKAAAKQQVAASKKTVEAVFDQ